MRNRPIFGTETDTLRLALKALGSRLPSGWCLREIKQRGGSKGTRHDAIVRIDAPDGASIDLILEIKSRMDPRDVPAVVDQVRRRAPDDTIWIAVPFLSPRTCERLKQERVCYSDSTGNMWIVSERPALYVETTGAEKNPRPEKRPLASLRGRIAGRVVRALCDFKPPYGIRQLADLSRTSLGSVARVVALLDREAIVSRAPRGGIADVNVAELIRRWTSDYSFPRSNQVEMFLEPRGLESLLEKLKAFRDHYAVTGSLATIGTSSPASPRLAQLYVDEIANASTSLVLRPAEAGANVLLARPFDTVVYERGFRLNGVRYSCLSQVAADLLTSPGRGPAEGEDLLRWMKENPDAWGTESVQ